MFTSKQRAKLRSLASTQKPIMQVGKEGLSENLALSLSDALEARELVKVTLLPAAGEDGENIAENLAELVGAEVVAVVGRKAIFYRRSRRTDIDHIRF